MDFLKNLGSTISGAVSSAGSYLSGLFNQGKSNLASIFPSASTFASPTQQATQATSTPTGPNISYTPLGPVPVPVSTANPKNIPLSGQGSLDASGNYKMSPAQLSSSVQSVANQTTGQSTPAFQTPLYQPYELGTYRSALPSGTSMGQNSLLSSRMSSRNSGVPYYDASGQLVIPKTGFTGLSGTADNSFSSMSSFSTPSTGSQGQSGTSSQLGLGGTSSIGTSSIGSTQSEEDKFLQDKKQQNTKVLGGSAQVNTPAFSPMVAPRDQLNVNVPSTFDFGNLTSVQQSLSKLINTPENLTSSDIQTLNDNLSTAFGEARKIIDAQSPAPENPIQDTFAQTEFINNSQDPYGIKQAIDTFKMQNTDLGNLQTQRIEVLKNIQALNSAYSPILDDIKNNPNLPKAVAARRLEQVQKQQKTTLEGFINQADLLNQAIKDQNDLVDRQFNIIQSSQNQAERAQANDFAKLKLFIDSGAIGAFTDADISKYSQLTGVSSQTLSKMRSSAQSPDLSIVTETDASGNVRGIDKNTGKTIWTLAGAGKPAVTDVKEFQGNAATYANRIEQASDILLSTAKTIQNYSPAKLQAYITAADFAPVLANKAIPDTVKDWLQASRNLINATLRKESGAVISPSEFQNARSQYLVMPGDSDAIINQKFENIRANRDALARTAGNAYAPYQKQADVYASGSQQSTPASNIMIDLSGFNFKF